MNLVTPEFGLIFWQTVTFLVVLFVLSRYAWKPILNALKDREHSIDNALQEADKARKDMERLKADNEKLLDEARIERDKILKTAHQLAQETRDEAKVQAQKDVDKMLADARSTIQAEKNSAIADIKKQVAILSIEVAETILQRELESPEKQKQLAADLIKDLKIN
jgi:F-type H+-transporting ATPase subunit b